MRYISGLDLSNGQIIGAVNDGTAVITPLGQYTNYPFFSQQVSDTVVGSQGTAQAVLAGMSQANRFAYQATATISGITSVRPGVPIVISGIDAVNDGTWWVQEAIHNITAASYSIDVSLGSDSVGDNGMRPIQGTAVAFSPGNPFAYTIANAPPTVLVNNRWRAAHASSVSLT